ncbi:MAG: transcription antitermination factor NusB [Phycisphaerales bacterium JB063]
MPKRRDIRRLAMQVLYQLDLSALHNPPSAEDLAQSLDDEHDSDATRVLAAEVALAAWACHQDADARVAALAPDWPTHRQPPVDRAILRLAYYEIVSGHAPAKVAINEAVELAKAYCAEQTPAFINGVLDKVAKQHASDDPDHAPEPLPAPPAKPQADAWLDDAVNG